MSYQEPKLSVVPMNRGCGRNDLAPQGKCFIAKRIGTLIAIIWPSSDHHLACWQVIQERGSDLHTTGPEQKTATETSTPTAPDELVVTGEYDVYVTVPFR